MVSSRYAQICVEPILLPSTEATRATHAENSQQLFDDPESVSRRGAPPGWRVIEAEAPKKFVVPQRRFRPVKQRVCETTSRRRGLGFLVNLDLRWSEGRAPTGIEGEEVRTPVAADGTRVYRLHPDGDGGRVGPRASEGRDLSGVAAHQVDGDRSRRVATPHRLSIEAACGPCLGLRASTGRCGHLRRPSLLRGRSAARSTVASHLATRDVPLP